MHTFDHIAAGHFDQHWVGSVLRQRYRHRPVCVGVVHLGIIHAIEGDATCLHRVARATFRAMRGFFGIGVERISKPMNVGNLFRSAHAFGADFVFAIAPAVDLRELYKSDTSKTAKHVPLYQYDDIAGLKLPQGCQLVGVELLDEAVDLPSFTHPEQAAYILGPERGSLSPELVARCDHTVKISTKFCVNVGIAGAILMYDRLITRGRHAPRPAAPGGPIEELPPHKHGGQFSRQVR
jgi:tRNA G18 (ribose-2'-O)-methylase SpoU